MSQSQPKSTREHEYPQRDINCTIKISEDINTEELGTPKIEWDAGHTPTQTEIDEAAVRAARSPYSVLYGRKEAAYQRLKAEFGSYNSGRVVAGECTAEELGAFLDSTEAQSVFQSLRALNFPAAAAKIAAMTEPLATEAFKAHWIAKVSAE